MIGTTRYARFAGLAALPALVLPFEKGSWLSIVPQLNPFKYNSFPVNGHIATLAVALLDFCSEKTR